ncbi:MAG TPA: alpha/beta hydrolase, partial [Flavobacterium sp.]|nr:alpha/beta hydrolase [Flavobacterium sp.]
YLISWIKYDPAIEIAKLKIPVLIINGTSDIQVTESEAKLLHQAKPDAKLVLIEKMNHVLKEVSSREENLASYNDPKLPLSPRLVEAVNQFLNEF